MMKFEDVGVDSLGRRAAARAWDMTSLLNDTCDGPVATAAAGGSRGPWRRRRRGAVGVGAGVAGAASGGGVAPLSTLRFARDSIENVCFFK